MFNIKPPEDIGKFSEWFVKEYSSQLYRSISRRLIPNRYGYDDVKHYMIERIIDIMQKRELNGNPIREPKIYFRKLVPFWCVEFQRMNGFIYCLPKRPRCAEAEKEISKHGFVYLKLHAANDYDNSYVTKDHVTKTSYIDTKTTEPSMYYHNYRKVGEEPDAPSEAWLKLMATLKKEEAAVMTCLYRYNLTVPQAARDLGIAVSTAYQRKYRALCLLSGHIMSKTNLYHSSWKTLDVIENK